MKYVFRGSATIESVKSTVGLWRTCVSSDDTTKCLKLALTCSQETSESLPACNEMMVSRAFTTIACIISALSALCLFACAIIRTDSNRIVMIISKILPLISLVAGVIGVAVGIAFINNSTPLLDYEIDVAAIMGITAVAINVIGALFTLMIR